ncbi:MAG: hypothetical protein GX535_16505, partial [Xanthomonadaceae bacterium]|nr:hypothetical protein [Xanthomonadaceae bacterium]
MASNPTDHVIVNPPSGEALFSSRAASRRKAKAGLDVLLTKAAIDFQNLSRDTGDPVLKENLEALREAAGLDVVLLAAFDEDRTCIESLVAATSMFATFNPEVLQGEPLERLPYFRDRLAHLRIVEIRDTSHPRRDLIAEAARLAALHIGAALIIGFGFEGRVCGFIALCSTLPRDSWDANLHLTLKLLGSSYASGMERL